MAFQPPLTTTSRQAATTALKVAVDPTTVTKKEYEDICGVSFDDQQLQKRLGATNYLYPKHVEVIEDIAPIAGEMVDSVVRRPLCVCFVCWKVVCKEDSCARNFLPSRAV